MKHELKTWPKNFQMVLDGEKTFEVRRFDRDFKIGDYLYLKEYYPYTDAYSGRVISCTVTYILMGGSFGIEPGFCVMSIKL